MRQFSKIKNIELRIIVVAIQLLSHVRLFVTLWTAARQASLSFTIPWSFLELMSIELVVPPNHLILCHPLRLLPSIFPSIRVFPVNQLFTSGQSIGASALASVLPMNIQDWFPLGWLSLLSKELSRVFSRTFLMCINSLALSHLYGPALPSIHDYWKNHSFDYTDLCQQNNVSAF